MDKNNFNIDIVKKIFDDIEISFKENVGNFHASLNKDNNEFFEKEQYTNLASTMEFIKKEDWIIKNASKKNRYDGIGNIGVVSNGNEEIILYMALKAIKTNNNIFFFVEEQIRQTSRAILSVIKNACEKNGFKKDFHLIECKTFSEIYSKADKIDEFVFIDKFSEYNEFISKNPTKKSIYNAYGTMNLYLDDKELRKELMQMDEYVYERNIALNLIKDTTVEEAVSYINSSKDNFCSVIFTKDTKKAYYFIENVKSDKVFINKNPKQEYKLNIDDSYFIRKKELFF